MLVDIEVKGAENVRCGSDSNIATAIRNALTLQWMGLPRSCGSMGYERKAAECAIEPLKGVKGIIDKIAIKPRTTVPLISQKDQCGLSSQRHESMLLIFFATVNGDEVELTGTVRPWAEGMQAEDVALRMQRITLVKNRLEVDSEILAD